VSINIKAAAVMAALLTGMSVSVPAAEQGRTLFNTPDTSQDRALWTTPAYYRNNTVSQLSGMALDIEAYGETGQASSGKPYGSAGTGKVGATKLASPYPFRTANEHYDAWLKDAKGGTKHTKATLPDWGGNWEGGGAFGGGQSPASDIVKLMTPEYQEHYVQELKASTEGRMWWPNAFCLPPGFFATLGAQEFVVTPAKVYTFAAGNGWNSIRWIYTDGSGHTKEDLQFPKWPGESVGFWNGDTLIVHTNQIRGWKGGISEYSDKMETVEKYRRVGDRLEGEITVYDPVVFARPIHSKLSYRLNTAMKPQERPLYNTCSDTNGPSPKVFMDDKGLLNEHIKGDPEFTWNTADPRPWGTWLTESDRRYKAYIAGGGKGPGRQ
jgi:hypothetical protein